jgi:cardiolipin synthase A/B
MRRYSLRSLLPPRFPWRNGNRIELLVDGERYFPAMLAAIDAAQHSIKLEMYLVHSGRVFSQFLAALTRAAQRGVRVRILLDDFGTQKIADIDRLALHEPGMELQFYNRLRWRKGLGNLLRNHRKALIIDRELAFTGGAGLADEFLYPGTPDTPWHEVMLSVSGPVVADWSELFERTWWGLIRGQAEPLATPVRPAQQGITRSRVCASNGPRAHYVNQSLYTHIAQARQRVWLVTPYFLPSLKLRRVLIQAALNKLDVRILVPGNLTDHPAIRHASRRHFARLLKQGVRIFEYQPRFIHAKIALCDDWCSIGSTNFDRWNLHWNLDANQEVDDADFAAQVHALVEQDFTHSEELHYASWLQRPWHLRVREWLNGKLDQLLSKLR